MEVVVIRLLFLHFAIVLYENICYNEEKQRRLSKGGTFMRIGKVLLVVVMVSFVLFSCLTLASLRLTYEELEKDLQEVREKIDACDEEIARYESDLSCDMDAAFIERTAREKLNLCHANEIIMEYHVNQ